MSTAMIGIAGMIVQELGSGGKSNEAPFKGLRMQQKRCATHNSLKAHLMTANFDSCVCIRFFLSEDCPG